MMLRRGNLTRFGLLIIGLFILVLSIVYSAGSTAPEGPDSINVVNSSRQNPSAGPVTVQAEAGNVTSLRIQNQRATEAWQGYFGNVSGNISLSDSSNNLFYAWQLANPTGEVYAANFTTTDWASVYCINVSQNGSNAFSRPGGAVSSINGSQIELSYGINVTDLDGLNETFNSTFGDTLRVGAVTFTSTSGCSMANPYSAGGPSGVWDELLLSDNDTIIFTSIIGDSLASYKASSEPADFQMLVLENGHVGSETTTTPYYFYVELA